MNSCMNMNSCAINFYMNIYNEYINRNIRLIPVTIFGVFSVKIQGGIKVYPKLSHKNSAPSDGFESYDQSVQQIVGNDSENCTISESF